MTAYSLFRSGLAGVLAAALLLTSVSCSRPLTTREKGALIGGAGAGIGGLTGGGRGAAIGGPAGVLGGAVVGDQLEKRDRDWDDDY